MATATVTPRIRKSAAEKRAEKEMALRISRRMFYTVTAYDSLGNAVITSDGVMTIENAECARDYMRSEFRARYCLDRIVVSDEFGYTY